MDYLLIENGVIVNNIICEDDETAALFGAVPSYEGAAIGDTYSPPAPDPTWNEDVDAMLVDHELRLSMVELGLDPKDESEVKK